VALTAYQQQTSRLLHDTGNVNYSLSDINYYIGVARNQLALDAQCIRANISVNLTTGSQQVFFSSIPASGQAGVGLPVVVRQVFYGQTKLENRSWEWFTYFYTATTVVGPPAIWSQQQTGTSGSFFVYPQPDAPYSVSLDTVFLPIALVNDSTVEAIGYPWTDAIPYFAAYLAFLNSNREQDAQAMWQMYLRFVKRGTALSTPTTLSSNFPGGEGAGLAGAHGNIGMEGQGKG